MPFPQDFWMAKVPGDTVCILWTGQISRMMAGCIIEKSYTYLEYAIIGSLVLFELSVPLSQTSKFSFKAESKWDPEHIQGGSHGSVAKFLRQNLPSIF